MRGKRKRLLVINSNYPHQNNLYGDFFVHARVKHYLEEFEVVVMGIDNTRDYGQFTYEGVEVKSFPKKAELVQAIFDFQPDAILIHFFIGWMLPAFISKVSCPVIIWVHGEEALGWYRRLFNFKSVKQFAGYILRNTKQLWQLRELIHHANHSGQVSFVFVSEWMRMITETDTRVKVKDSHIIPNPIDSSVFMYFPKNAEDRKKILLIRSFGSKKYANDLAVEAIIRLSKKNFFSELTFSIYGEGKDFANLTEELKQFPNVSLHNYFIENKMIPQAHREHGIFLCPTRQDAQGVSMCEAMSSGLVPISSLNTAIPEFLVDGQTGYMTNSAHEIANRIEYLFYHPEKFMEMSERASIAIQEKSGHHIVIEKEINLIQDRLALITQ